MTNQVITVKVIRVPGAVTEVGLNTGATVKDALDAAGVTIGRNESVKLNGTDTSMDTCLQEGARILVAKAAKGA